ncbi:hypothetical protein AHV17_003460 [Salmonella enterica subsp. enterica serovar Texas]|nr:hypothetical protein [Salmonella enterica subsp. enterica serovar Texas]
MKNTLKKQLAERDPAVLVALLTDLAMFDPCAEITAGLLLAESSEIYNHFLIRLEVMTCGERYHRLSFDTDERMCCELRSLLLGIRYCTSGSRQKLEMLLKICKAQPFFMEHSYDDGYGIECFYRDELSAMLMEQAVLCDNATKIWLATQLARLVHGDEYGLMKEMVMPVVSAMPELFSHEVISCR